MTESRRDVDVYLEQRDEQTYANSASQNAFYAFLRCPPDWRRNLTRFCASVQILLTRGRTLRSLPRVFILRRAFFLFWILTVILFVYLKWYFPLYLTSTVNRNSLEEFKWDWCRVRRVSINWELLRSPCEGNTKFGRSLPGWGIENRTDPRQSFIPYMDIRSAGEFSRFSIQSQTSSGQPKAIGGDDWRVLIWGPSVLAPTVIDHKNGTYEVLFLILEPGTYSGFIVLDYSLCDGMKNPPEYWFMIGKLCVHACFL